ncbi:MAG TPA: MFS transporter [Solirubrobacteraceae bacterium]|nr:MFS transporter [Solirubrobacteraceae bacterium]
MATTSVATDDRRPLALQWPCARMMLMTVAGFTGFFVTLPSLPAYVASAGNSTAAAGATTTVMLAATVLFQPAVPALLRRLSTPATVAIGLVALGLPAPLLIWASSGAGLYAICVLRGVGFAVFTVAGAYMASEVAPPGRQGEATGLYGLAAAIPNVVLIPLAVLILHAFGFWPIAAIAGLPVLGAALAVGGGWRRVAPEPAQAVPTGATPRAITRSLLPATVLCALTITGGAVVTILPIVRSELVATVGLLAFTVAAALARWQAGVQVDRPGRTWLLAGACGVAIAGLLALAAGLSGPSNGVVLAACGMLGVGYGAVQCLTLVYAFARTTSSERPVASAVWNGAFDAGTATGAVLIGALSATRIGWWGTLAVLAVLVAAVVPAAVLSTRH